MKLYENNRGKAINIFDIDDSLVVTNSKIRVTNPKTGFSTELTPQEFNTFERRPHDEMDFSDFRNVEILKAGLVIEWVFNILKRTINKGKPVGIITARDSGDLIREFLSHHGININPNYIFAVNDNSLGFSGDIASRKKQAFEKFIEMGFTDFKFFDDDEKNIKLAKSITKDYPQVKMIATLIKKKWIPKFNDYSKR